ncbi:MAG: flagellar brake protein [Thiogranum sp.]
MPGLSRRGSQEQRRPDRDWITSPIRIRAILVELEASHEVLSASVPDGNEVSATAILEVHDSDGSFRLEHLDSETAHRALLQSGEIHLACRLRGMQLSFTTRLMDDTEPEDARAAYRLALPASLSCSQRRENFRIRLGPGLAVSVTVPDLDGETVKGDAFDLSATGIGLFLHTRRTPSRGQRLPGVTLDLPHSRPVRCTLEIRYVHKNAVYRTLRVGARFVGLEPSQQKLLDRFLAEQRRKRRHHTQR